MKKRLKIAPISIRQANEMVKLHHRHSKPMAFAKFAISVTYDGEVVGVAIIGRPVATQLDDGQTVEVARVCTTDESPKNVCSMLYSAAWRAWKAQGGTRIVTYTLQEETGTSLKASGWRITREVPPNSWNRPNRKRNEQAVYKKPKLRWEPHY
jgi:hypothetical protein